MYFQLATYFSNYTINYSSAPILFASSSTPWSGDNNSGSIIQNAILNAIDLQISGASPKIDNCLFNFTSQYPPLISISGGSPIISNSTIGYNGPGSSDYVNSINIYGGTPLITNNLFEGDYSGSNNDGINVYSGAPLITNNQFDGDEYLNAIVSSSTDSFTVSNNIFSNCKSGIEAQTGSILTVEGNSFLSGTDGLDIASGASLTITDNLIDSNSRYGITGGGYISSNTITNNQIGIHNPPTGTITNNNIVGNTVNSITATTADIDAQNNWWGITDTQTINQTIYDAKVDSHLGTVTFVPFLTQPSQTAPAIPISTPIITPLPTLLPTPTPAPAQTEEPVITTPTSTPIPYSLSFVYQVSNIINLNLITTATAIILILAWLIVILGYAAKRGISKLKDENYKSCLILSFGTLTLNFQDLRATWVNLLPPSAVI